MNLIKIDRFAPSSKTCGKCGLCHDCDFNAACNIKEFGLKALPSERGDVKPIGCPTVDCPTVDDRPRVLKKTVAGRSRKKEEVLVSPKPLNL